MTVKSSKGEVTLTNSSVFSKMQWELTVVSDCFKESTLCPKQSNTR